MKITYNMFKFEFIIAFFGGIISKMKRIGMRNFKTALSVFLCLLFYEFINRDNAVLACIAAVICVQNTFEDSMQTGRARVIGTIIGGFTGALVLYIVNTYFNDNILVFVIPLGIILLIQICVTINMKKAVVICCVVYLIVVISKNHEDGYVLYTVHRVLDTSIGIVIALLVNKYVKVPEKIKLMFKKHNTGENNISQDTSGNISEAENQEDSIKK